MSSLALINPPIGMYDVAEIAPPLSLLGLACSARPAEDIRILDFNLPQHRERADGHRFIEYALEAVAALNPSRVGITSMGVNTHIAALLANALAGRLGIRVALGGVHAKSIAPTLRSVLVPGVIIDGGNEEMRSRALAPREVPPAIAAHINVSEYFSGNPRRVANLEAGRGCRYRCALILTPWVKRSAP
jgi:hypothetical protein